MSDIRARGIAQPYAGSAGQTRIEAIHWSCTCGEIATTQVHRAVNVTRSPELAGRLRDGALNRAICRRCGAEHLVELPVLVHDEKRRVFTLLLPQSFRHRELLERAELLAAIARDATVPVPEYVREADVAFTWEELEAQHRDDTLTEADQAAQAAVLEIARREDQLVKQERLLTEREQGVTSKSEEIARREQALDGRAKELAAHAERLATRERELDRQASELTRKAEARSAAPAREVLLEPSGPMTATGVVDVDATPAPGPLPTRLANDDATGPFQREDWAPATETTDPDRVAGAPRKADRPRPTADALVEKWMASGAEVAKMLDAGRVRLLARLGQADLEPFAVGELTARVHLYRLPTYALLVLSIAPAAASPEGRHVAFPFDLGRDDDLRVLTHMKRLFRATVEIYDSQHLPVVTREVEAPLEENLTHAMAGAEEHLAALPKHMRSVQSAMDSFRAPTFDRFGKRAHSLSEDSFQLLPTAGTALAALNIVGYWSEPEREDQLILVKSFPLPWWKKIQARVAARSIEHGLALPAALADAALAAGVPQAGKSRRELTQRLLEAYARVCTNGSHDLTAEVEHQNWQALLGEAESVGIQPDRRALELARDAAGRAGERNGRGADTTSEPRGNVQAAQSAGRRSAQVVSGELELPELPQRRDVRGLPVPELIELLDDKEHRRDAALELANRGDASSVGPVFAAVRRMTRGEAARVLPGVVSFGEGATPHLLDGLRSRKGYLRHGCALALGVLRSAEGIEPLCELLMSEPTEVWREVARALGEVGGGAVMSLAARARNADEEGQARISWAMANLASKASGRQHVETLAQGRDAVVARCARLALEQSGNAKSNDREVRGGPAPPDQTVNRAFSRRFFEILAGGVDVADADLEEEGDDELLLDDADIVVADDSRVVQRPVRPRL